jgi:signal peptidase II
MWTVAKTALAVLVVDQLSKVGVVFGLGLATKGAIEVLPPYLDFRMAWNQGVNFGLFASSELSRWIFVAVALAISAWVWIWIRGEGHGRWAQMAAGLLIGGALGNVIDRIAYGRVADFLNMSCCGFNNPFSFNLADVAVFCGAVGLVLLTGRQSPRDGPGMMG